MVQQIIANMLSETVYTGITNLYIITKNQQNTKQYIININSVFWRALFLASFWKCLRYCSREARLLIVRSIDEVRQLQMLSQRGDARSSGLPDGYFCYPDPSGYFG